MARNGWLGSVLGTVAVAAVAVMAYGGHRLWLSRPGYAESDTAFGSIASRASARPTESGTSASSRTASGANSSTATPTALPDADRKYLWDVEHVAFVLDVHIFPRMARVIRESDRAGFASFLSERFRGGILARDQQRSAAYPFADFAWAEGTDERSTGLNRDQFVDYVFEQRRLLVGDTRVAIRLMRLSPVRPDDLDGPWRGTMKFRLAGERAEGEPAEVEFDCQFTFASPKDELDQWKRWLESCRVYSFRFGAARQFLTREVAAERGIDRRRFYDNWNNPDTAPNLVHGGAYVCDYDHDGRLDVLIPDPNTLVLYHGNGDGTFTDETKAAGLGRVESRMSPAIFVDFDGDGYEELVIGTQIFRNNRDGTFTDVTVLSNLRLPPGAAGYAVADYNLDGRMDIYVLRLSEGLGGRSGLSWVGDRSGVGNQLWENLGALQFRNVTAQRQATGGHRSCFAAAWMDVNSDGRPDVAISDEFGSSVLLVNQPDGRFHEQEIDQGFCMGIVAGDVDNDGNMDIYLANMYSKAGDRVLANLRKDAYPAELRGRIDHFVTGSELLLGDGKLGFESAGRRSGVHAVGWAYGPALVDLNNDGWLDIYAPAGFLSYERGDPDG